MLLHIKDSDMVQKRKRKFSSNRKDSYWGNWKCPKMFFWSFRCFFLAVGLITYIRFWCQCTQRTLIWCRKTVENFLWPLWRFFGLLLAMFVKSQSYGFDAIAKMDPKKVKNDCKNFRLTALTFFFEKNWRSSHWPINGPFGATFVCQITVMRFWCHCTHRTFKRSRMTNVCRNYVPSAWHFLKKIEDHNWSFPDNFGSTFGFVS